MHVVKRRKKYIEQGHKIIKMANYDIEQLLRVSSHHTTPDSARQKLCQPTVILASFLPVVANKDETKYNIYTKHGIGIQGKKQNYNEEREYNDHKVR